MLHNMEALMTDLMKLDMVEQSVEEVLKNMVNGHKHLYMLIVDGEVVETFAHLRDAKQKARIVMAESSCVEAIVAQKLSTFSYKETEHVVQD